MNTTRRNFIKTTSTGAAALALGGILPQFSAASYAQIAGANKRVRVAVAGVNSRGRALAANFANQPGCEVACICDVDGRAIEKCLKSLASRTDKTPAAQRDFRRALEDKDIDALVIATPDHWHTPAALLALQAGKHVYLEKPVSHNPLEGEMLVEASKKYGKVVQIGTQRRSWPNVVEAIRHVQSGGIGKVHFGKGWYANKRTSIGRGNPAPVPASLDWDLWQGPAPRVPYRDNIVHYNWHWFWNWGTAESLNNGTHMIDLLCWGMNLKYPTKVSSLGGRYYYQDDWETPDTQIATFNFGDRATLTWEGHSCNPKPIEGSTVGVVFYGDAGSVYISGGNDYKIYDPKGKMIKEVKRDNTIDPNNKVSPAQRLDAIHILNFLDGIRNGAPLNMSVEEGHQCTLLMQLANISLRTGATLATDPATGRILGNPEAQRYWTREYERGWEPKV
ncbi:Gfo/Idh/MocA family oxidoreductase [Ereboglobus luteus]|uniref:Dehydrogenase n=1 Tax=Ereboglobus luteus TaxID=1796921 RepID=A0A2U8E4P4_9BACT|nr:Gfo/Idh/MocA family oxidoreductase [Ereboglobus luteus]AWI09837.1 dehydrogenase [Ereboglobus luteus]